MGMDSDADAARNASGWFASRQFDGLWRVIRALPTDRRTVLIEVGASNLQGGQAEHEARRLNRQISEKND